MTIKTELLAIQESSEDGLLHPRDVVEWARRHRQSALHSALEWDDTKAADGYRLWQARKLIQLNITREDGTPLMVSLSVDREMGGGYRAIIDVAKAPDLRDIMLQDALAELDRVRKKYQHIKELIGVWEAADKARATHPHRHSKGDATAAHAG